MNKNAYRLRFAQVIGFGWTHRTPPPSMANELQEFLVILRLAILRIGTSPCTGRKDRPKLHMTRPRQRFHPF